MKFFRVISHPTVRCPTPRFRSDTLLLLLLLLFPGRILSHTQLARRFNSGVVGAPGYSRTALEISTINAALRAGPAELLIKTSLLPPYLVLSKKCVFIPRAKAFRRMLDTPLA